MKRIHAKLGMLSAEQLAAVEALTRGLVNKFLHPPMQALKQAARENDSTRVDALCEAWSLPSVADAAPKSVEAQSEASPLPTPMKRAKARSAAAKASPAPWEANESTHRQPWLATRALAGQPHCCAFTRAGHSVEIEIIKTTGDRLQEVTFAQVGSKGMFTKEIEEALAEGRVDLAVHSLKDLPTELPEPFTLAATPPRVDPRDVLVSVKYHSLAQLPQGARGGHQQPAPAGAIARYSGPTSRPLSFAAMWTRACANSPRARLTRSCWLRLVSTGLRRLSGCANALSRKISVLPRGKVRWASRRARTIAGSWRAIAFLDDPATRFAVTAERAALAALGGGCQVPIGIHCRVAPQDEAGEWQEIFAVVADPATGKAVRIHHESRRSEIGPVALGQLAAEMLLEAGAGPLLEATAQPPTGASA